MREVFREKQAVVTRVSNILESLFESNSLFREKLNQAAMIQLISRLVEENLTDAQLGAIDDDELTRRIRQILATEMMSNLLDDLTSEQVAVFDAAVKGR